MCLCPLRIFYHQSRSLALRWEMCHIEQKISSTDMAVCIIKHVNDSGRLRWTTWLQTWLPYIPLNVDPSEYSYWPWPWRLPEYKTTLLSTRIYFRESYELQITSYEISLVEFIVFIYQFAVTMHLPIQHLSNIFGRHLERSKRAQNSPSDLSNSQ